MNGWARFRYAPFEMAVDLYIQHVVQRVVKRLQIRIDLLLQRSRQKTQPLACLNGGSRQDNPADFFFDQCANRHADGKVRLSGTGGPDPENHVVLFDRLEVQLLVERLGREATFSDLKALDA